VHILHAREHREYAAIQKRELENTRTSIKSIFFSKNENFYLFRKFVIFSEFLKNDFKLFFVRKYKKNQKHGKSAEIVFFRPNFRKIIGTEHHCSHKYNMIYKYFVFIFYSLHRRFRSRKNKFLISIYR
jgi:hypothetical protein